MRIYFNINERGMSEKMAALESELVKSEGDCRVVIGSVEISAKISEYSMSREREQITIDIGPFHALSVANVEIVEPGPSTIVLHHWAYREGVTAARGNYDGANPYDCEILQSEAKQWIKGYKDTREAMALERQKERDAFKERVEVHAKLAETQRETPVAGCDSCEHNGKQMFYPGPCTGCWTDAGEFQIYNNHKPIAEGEKIE